MDGPAKIPAMRERVKADVRAILVKR